MFIKKRLIYIYIYSRGLRPNGVSGFLLDGRMVKGSYFQLILGTPPSQKLGVAEWRKSLWRRLGAPRFDLFDLLVHDTKIMG